jgi:F0F1-type ATP synthase assembly protein I
VANQKNSGQVVFAHITIGLQLGITMFIFVYGGHRLDLYFNKSPLFLIVGTVLGMCIGFYHLLKELHVGDKKKDKDADEKIKPNVKWN